MKKLILSVAVVAIGLMVSGVAEAKGKPSGGNSTSQTSKPQQLGKPSNNVQASKSYPKNYSKFGSYCWNSKFGCCFFYCPTSCCYYYWYAPSSCYFPVSCIETYPPTKFESEKVQVTQITNVNVDGQQTNQEIVSPPAGSGPSVHFKAPVK